MKKIILVLFAILISFQMSQAEVIQTTANPYTAIDTKYSYMYANPPKQSFFATGHFIFSTSKLRYVHSPSKLKGIKHAARINANNMAYQY